MRRVTISLALLSALAACTTETMQTNAAMMNGGQVMALTRPNGNGTMNLDVTLYHGANKPWTCQGTFVATSIRETRLQTVPLTCYGLLRSGRATVQTDARTGGLQLDYLLDGGVEGRLLLN